MSSGRNRRSKRTRRKASACDGKKTYRNELDAMRASVRGGLTWYRCPYCHKYHLSAKREMDTSSHREYKRSRDERIDKDIKGKHAASQKRR